MTRSWCLYLPGVCMHVADSSDGAEPALHHQSPGVNIQYDCTFDLNSPLNELHPALSLKPQPPRFAIPPTMKSLSSDRLTSNHQAFENTSTSVAASQMRNALNSLADTVSDPEEKKVYFGHSSVDEENTTNGL